MSTRPHHPNPKPINLRPPSPILLSICIARNWPASKRTVTGSQNGSTRGQPKSGQERSRKKQSAPRDPRRPRLKWDGGSLREPRGRGDPSSLSSRDSESVATPAHSAARVTRSQEGILLAGPRSTGRGMATTTITLVEGGGARLLLLSRPS